MESLILDFVDNHKFRGTTIAFVCLVKVLMGEFGRKANERGRSNEVTIDEWVKISLKFDKILKDPRIVKIIGDKHVVTLEKCVKVLIPDVYNDLQLLKKWAEDNPNWVEQF